MAASADPATALAPNLLVHRLGGGSVENLRLKPKEAALTPPGISVLLGSTPQEVAAQVREAFPDERKYSHLHQLTRTIGTATVQAIRSAGFDVIPNASKRFANHGRIIHSGGAAGFSDAALTKLASMFQETNEV